MDINRFVTALKLPPERAQALSSLGLKLLLFVGGSYAAASGVSSWMMSAMLDRALDGRPAMRRQAAVSTVSLKRPNYHDIRKAIKDRNVFNSAGEFPDETESLEDEPEQQEPVSSFDINAPCQTSRLPIELLGTIHMTRGSESLATIKEKGFEQADIYRVGDHLIDRESAQIVDITRNRVVLNNEGRKECVQVKEKKKKSTPGVVVQPPTPAAETPVAVDGDSNQVSLEEKYVQDQLGPGFGTIITKARLVPNTTNNVMNGFKIFAIDPKSLLAKVGLKNGDIITRVNETSLKEPSQGFALYQAFQDEREVAIQVLRGGKTPKMINVQIR